MFYRKFALACDAHRTNRSQRKYQRVPFNTAVVNWKSLIVEGFTCAMDVSPFTPSWHVSHVDFSHAGPSRGNDNAAFTGITTCTRTEFRLNVGSLSTNNTVAAAATNAIRRRANVPEQNLPFDRAEFERAAPAVLRAQPLALCASARVPAAKSPFCRLHPVVIPRARETSSPMRARKTRGVKFSRDPRYEVEADKVLS